MSLIHCAIMGISFFIRPLTEQKNPMSTKKFVNSFFSGKKSVNIIIFSRYQRELMNLVICLSPLFTNKRTERFWLAVLQVSCFFSIFHYSSTPFKNIKKLLLLCSPTNYCSSSWLTRSINQFRNQQPILWLLNPVSKIFIPNDYVKFLSASYFDARSTDTQWRHKSENLGRCGRQNMLWPYLKIWDWGWIFGRAVKAISSLGVRSPWNDHCI